MAMTLLSLLRRSESTLAKDWLSDPRGSKAPPAISTHQGLWRPKGGACPNDPPLNTPLEPREKCDCIRTMMTHRLICNTYLRHSSVQVIWPTLMPIFPVDLAGWKWISFDASWRDEYDGVEHFSLPFLVKKTFKKTSMLLKNQSSLLDILWKVQNVAYGSQIGYGWIQNVLNFPFVFAAMLYCK